MKTWLRTLAIAAAATLSPLAHAQTTLDFPTWQAEEPGVSTWWKDLIAAYEKKYPDVKVNMQQVPFAQFVKQMTVRFAAGSPPDIVHLPSRDFASFADQGWLEPLDERLKATDITANWPPLQSEMSVERQDARRAADGLRRHPVLQRQDAEGREGRACRRRRTSGSRR